MLNLSAAGLTEAEKLFLDCVRSCVSGERLTSGQEYGEDVISSLVTLSMEQKLLPAVYDAMPSAFPSGVRRNAIGMIVSQTSRDALFTSLCNAMEEAGIRFAVLKGIICRGSYPNGALRISGDNDLLTDKESFDALRSYLISRGYKEEGPLSEGEQSFSGPAGLIELHVSPFDPETEFGKSLCLALDGCMDRTRLYPVESGALRSLSPQDHLVYLICHALKHFCGSGVGVRQLCDIGLWAKKYSSEISFGQLCGTLESVNALGFARAVFDICAYLGIKTGFEESPIDSVPLLIDALRGGIYGTATEEREHAASVTSAAVGSRSKGIFSALFPPCAQLLGRYPVLEKHPALLPLIWLVRIARYIWEKIRGKGDSASDSLRVARQRTELLKLYGII